MFGQIVKKWQPFSKLMMAATATLNFSKYFFDVIYMLQIEVPMFPLILVTIGQILKKWQQLFEIQDGGGRHLELWLLRFFIVIDVF